MQTQATFKTDSASRYLGMLCAHFSRKVDAECDTHSGWVQFSMGRCEMSADEAQLRLHASADDQKTLDQIMQIVTSHLERFAFREHPDLTWHPAQTPDS